MSVLLRMFLIESLCCRLFGSLHARMVGQEDYSTVFLI